LLVCGASALTISHHIDRLPIPIEVRPHVSAAIAKVILVGPADADMAYDPAELIDL